MARTIFRSFDALDTRVDFNSVTALPSGVTYDTAIKRTGAASLKFVASSGADNAYVVDGGVAQLWHRIYVRVTARPSTTRRIILGQSSSVNLQLNPDGTLAYYNSTVSQGTSTTALTDDTKWYRIEWRGGTDTSVVVLKIDGVDEVTASPSAWSARGILGSNDTVADTYTLYFDDYSADNATAPGEGAVVLLLPVSDSARSTEWVAGSNATTATTNLWEGVNNTPPVGTATSNAVTAAISHEGGATGDYDANMTTYTDAGIGAGATINAMQAISVTGEDISTGAKVLTMSIKSNPAQGAFETNWTVGTSAVGTYPTNWTITRGTIISSPSVTLGTSPVMTMRRPETASRRADVCFMGIYVDYTEGAPADPVSFPPVPPRHPMMHLLVR